MDTICIDVGGTSIKHASVDENGNIREKSSFRTPSNKKTFLEKIRNLVKSYEEKQPIQSISFSFPGYINTETGFAETAGSIEYFSGENVLKEVSDALDHLYPIYIENDANCAAIAEKNSGNAQENSTFLLLTIGTGVGGAFFINNTLHRGFQYKAGEFGRMRINHTHNPDKQLNDFSSIRTLISRYKEVSHLQSNFQISGEEIFDQQENNIEVNELVDKWIDTICIGIFNVITVLNPEKVLVGGGISANALFINRINDRMNLIDDWHEFKVPIQSCKYFNDAGLLGAFYHAKEKAMKEKKK